MSDDRDRPDKPTGVAVSFWFGGTLVLLLFAGFVTSVVYFLTFGAVLLARFKPFVGIPAAIAVVGLFFGPGMFDRAVFTRQIEEVQAGQIAGEPVDLTGAHVLFMGASGRYHPDDCTDLCRNIAAFGGAEGVYFGRSRSADRAMIGQPVDLLRRRLYQFAEPLAQWPEEGTPTEAVTPGEIDYVVYQGNLVDAGLRDGLLPQVSDFGFYPMGVLHLEYAIYAVEDATAFDVSTATPLFTRFEFARRRATVPDIPRLLSGDMTFDHRFDPGQSQWNTANTRAAAVFLCGAPTRAAYDACTYIP